MKISKMLLAICLLGAGHVDASEGGNSLAQSIMPLLNHAGVLVGSGQGCEVTYEEAGKWGKFYHIKTLPADVTENLISFSFDGPNEKGGSVVETQAGVWQITSYEPCETPDPEVQQCRGHKAGEAIVVSGNSVRVVTEENSATCEITE